jgi:AcrR family transcriptional regulator
MRSAARSRKASKAGRPTAAELERRKKRVLEVATELFLKHGYEGTSLSDIARKASVATRTLYQHFGDKTSIFAAIVDARIKQAEIKLDGISDDQSLTDVLMQIAQYICGMSFDQEAIPFTRLMIAESSRFPKLMNGIAQSIRERFRANVVQAFKALAARGDIPDGNHTESANVFVDLIVGLAPLRAIMSLQSEPPSTAELAEKVGVFIRGYFGYDAADRGRRVVSGKRAKSATA